MTMISYAVPKGVVLTNYVDDNIASQPKDFNLMYVRQELHMKVMALFGADKPSPQPADNMTFNEALEILLNNVDKESLVNAN